MRIARRVATAGLVIMAAACGTGDAAQTSDASTVPSVEPTGTVIEVTMASVGGEVFGPAEVSARRGDVLRFVLESGVHNVSFPAEQNVAGVRLPDASPYLQVPGQSHDILIDLPAGEYNFHCDPHAVLGMVGTLTVTD